MPSSPHSPETDQAQISLPLLHDILIIGAGPCGLALAARLRESTPSALYTDEEHRRFHWLLRHRGKSAVKDRRTGTVTAPKDADVRAGVELSGTAGGGLLVLDAEGRDWMARWKRLFAVLGIERLRSPMFFHPDPADRDALRAFAYEQGREAELVELAGCVGREVSKHRRKKMRRDGCRGCGAGAPNTVNERERSDYFTPSAALFEDFCGGLVERYGLAAPGLVREAKVGSLEYGVVREVDEVEKVFTVRTDRGVVYARAVALAVGPGETPTVPSPFATTREIAKRALTVALERTAWDGLIPPSSPLAEKIRAGRRTSVVVIGGGLTSAQVSDLCLRKGVSEVWHLMRGPMKVKPFDVDLSWMGKFRNQEKAAFWMADSDEERAEMLRAARGGGSITPAFAKVLQKHSASGRLRLCVHTALSDACYDADSESWSLVTSPVLPDLPRIDHVFLATGSTTPFHDLPFLQTLLAEYPIESEAGFPALTDDLQWCRDVPLFVTGKFASLRLGPGAGNLEGARAGAERIALALQGMGIGGVGHGEARRDSGYGDVDEASPHIEKTEGGERQRYAQGFANRFEMLEV